jgi:hypothetical protein
MLYIIYHNHTKFIANMRVDLTTPTPAPAEVWFADFVDTHNVTAADYTIVVHPDSKAQVVLGRDMYDPNTKTIVADPNWVAPVSTYVPAPPAEPTV